MKRLTRSGRMVAAAVPLIAAVMVVGFGGAATNATHGGKAQLYTGFRNDYLDFRYPAAWRPSRFTVTGTLHFQPMLYLTMQPTSNPCRQTTSQTVCGWPVERLRPGGVLIVWENRGYPGWSLQSAAGTPLRVGGRPARRTISRPGACSAIGADETVDVAIARPLTGNWTNFTACLRGPGLSASEQQIDGVLASTRFRTP